MAGGEPKPSKDCGFCCWAEKLNGKARTLEAHEENRGRKNNLLDFA
ncbi:hypothetical protein H0O02_04145 [Candidatus Micrarchaeota archaeon]|nr:hypothetical protein [Candidatus Micrarchaeota archaeon]